MKRIITVLTLLLSILAVSTCQPEDPIEITVNDTSSADDNDGGSGVDVVEFEGVNLY